MISTTSITSRFIIRISVSVVLAALLFSAVYYNSQSQANGQHDDTLVSEELSPSWLKKVIHRRAKAGHKSGKVHRGKGGKDDDYCDMRLFEGHWAYAQGCDGNSYDVVIYRHGRKKYIYKETAVGGECTSEGKFKPKDQFTLDEEGNCILDLIHLKDSCDDSRSLSVRVVAPKEEENNEDGVLQLYFSSDGGNTFDNEDTPREAIPDASSDEDTRRILHEQARRRLCKLECSKECQEEVDEKHNLGRDCCKDKGITNEQCSLNGPGNTCTCAADGRECYIEMRCPEYATWQDEKCKIKPFEYCTQYEGHTCTNGYSCQKTARGGAIHNGCERSN